MEVSLPDRKSESSHNSFEYKSKSSLKSLCVATEVQLESKSQTRVPISVKQVILPFHVMMCFDSTPQYLQKKKKH